MKTLDEVISALEESGCVGDGNLNEIEAESVEAWNKAIGALLPEGDPQKNDGCKCSNITERE